MAPVFGSYSRAWDFETLSKKRAMWMMGGDSSAGELEESGRRKARLIAGQLAPTDRVLEIGCGTGRIMKHLAPECAELHGIDVSRRVLGLAKAHLGEVPNVTLHRGSGSDLGGLDSETFDFCYSNQVFSTLRREDVLKYLAEMQRVLTPGGKILVHFLSLEDPRMAAEFREYAMESSMLTLTRRRYYTAVEVRIFAEINGFEDVSVETEGDAHWLRGRKPKTARAPTTIAEPPEALVRVAPPLHDRFVDNVVMRS